MPNTIRKNQTTDMVAHIWAQGGDHYVTSYSLHADGASLYTYGVLLGYNAGDVVFINASNLFSVTSNRHRKTAYRSVRGDVECHFIPGLDDLRSYLGWRTSSDKLSRFFINNWREMSEDGRNALARHFRINKRKMRVFENAVVRLERNEQRRDQQRKRRDVAKLLKVKIGTIFAETVKQFDAIDINGSNFAVIRNHTKKQDLFVLQTLRFANSQNIYKKRTIQKIRSVRKELRRIIAECNQVERTGIQNQQLNNLRKIIVTCDKVLFGNNAEADALRHDQDAVARLERAIGIFQHEMHSNKESVVANARECALIVKSKAHEELKTLTVTPDELINEGISFVNAFKDDIDEANRLRERRKKVYIDEQNFQREQERIRILEKDKRDIDAWLDGSSNYKKFDWKDQYGGVLLRVVGDKLETSQGAEVPLRHAIVAFQRVLRCYKTNTEWKRNGDTIRVGHFQIDHIQANGNFTAGCHFISFYTAYRMAQKLGVV